MKGRDILKAIMDARGVSNAELAARLGISQATAWDRVNSVKVKDIPAGLLAEMARAMDYKVVVMPREARTPAEAYEVG